VLIVVSVFITSTAPRGYTAPAALTVWTVGTATKVQPTTALGSGSTIVLEGARDSYEAYQIIVRAGASGLSGVNLSASALSDGVGHTLPAANLSFFREAFIDFTGVTAAGGTLNVPPHSPTNDGRIPDPLIPFTDPYSGTVAGAPFTVTANLNQPVWLDVFIPANAVAGTYTGSLTVTATSQPAVNIPITLTVWNLTLPDMRAVTTHFRMSVNDLIQYHSGTWQCSGVENCWLDWNPRARTIVKRYEELAHAHRIDTAEEFVPDPSNGCAPPTDWLAYDAAMQPYMNGSYWSDGVPSGRLGTPFTPGAYWGPEAACSQAQYTALATAWSAHLKAKGWFSRAIVYALDEPAPADYGAIAQNAQWLQNGDPAWKAQIMDTVPAMTSSVSILNPALDIYALCLKCYEHWSDVPDRYYGRAEWAGLFAQGLKMWFYESNAQDPPYPTYATNTLIGSEPRIMKWGAWYEGASGFLMWDTTAWTVDKPWGPNIGFNKTGDGVLIYPGNHDGLEPAHGGSPPGVTIDGPVPSYRLKMIRAGLQDWALFNLAEQYGLRDYARTQVAHAYSQLGGCSWSGCPPPVNGSWYWQWDDATLTGARHNIAQAIMNVQATLTHHIYLPVILK
jgi:hypothetical protein